MPIVLPTQKLEPSRLTPKILLIYSLPKVGKTKMLSELDDCLILDNEEGSHMYECMRVDIRKTADIDEVLSAINVEATARVKRGERIYPYKYIALDTVSVFEDMAEISATQKYKGSAIGKSFTGQTVLELPQGLGYYYNRTEVLSYIDKLARVCEHLILTCHVKDKLIQKDGAEVSVKDLSLTGKLAGIVAAKADAIGYMYRNKNSELMISFQTLEDKNVGTRCAHLVGKNMQFTSWEQIYDPTNFK